MRTEATLAGSAEPGAAGQLSPLSELDAGGSLAEKLQEHTCHTG